MSLADDQRGQRDWTVLRRIFQIGAGTSRQARHDPRDQPGPVVGRGIVGLHAAGTLSLATERLGPAGPRGTPIVEGRDRHIGAVLVERDEPDPGVAGELQFETADAAFRILVEMRQHTLDEWMPRSIE